MSDYTTILVSREGRVGTITLNRPEALNALNQTVMEEVVHAAQQFDEDRGIGAIVLTGSAKAFAAGADIKQMVELDYVDVSMSRLFDGWDAFAALQTPVIAAVAGYALGGGCELAMMCDIIVAADTARFGQPEIALGVIPGIGGTQRLTRAVGKYVAMDMVLTGRMITAAEAERAGLVSRVVPADALLEEVQAIAAGIARKSLPVAVAAKESVNVALETSLAEGVRFERRRFYSTFALKDRAEGMRAFIEKRDPDFRHS